MSVAGGMSHAAAHRRQLRERRRAGARGAERGPADGRHTHRDPGPLRRLGAPRPRGASVRGVSAPGVTRWDRLPRSRRVCRVWPRAECGRVGSDPRGVATAHAVAGASARCLVGQRLPGRRLRPVSSLVLGPRDWARWGDGAIVYHGATPPVYRSSRGQVTLAGRVHVEYPGHPQGQVRRGIQRCATGVLPGSSGRSTPPPSGVHEPGTARARSAT